MGSSGMSPEEELKDEENSRIQLKQNECFTKHCRIFYQHSLSISKNNNNENSNKTEDDINTSSEIMNVFHSLLLSSQQQQQQENGQQQKTPIMIKKTDIGYSELIKCGLNEINNYNIIEFTKIRDNERRKAHELGMKHRFKIFHNMILEYQSNNNTINNSNHNNNNNRDQYNYNLSIKYIKHFVSLYKKNIGMHPIFAGIRKLLETQIKNDEYITYWKFYSITITESFDNNNDNIVNDTNNCCNNDNEVDNHKKITSYYEEICNMLFSFLMLVVEDDEEEEEEKKEGMDNNENDDDGSGSMLLRWKVKESFNRRKMRKLLHCFPKECDIYAKPTGKFIITDMVRNNNNNGKDKDFWCFWC